MKNKMIKWALCIALSVAVLPAMARQRIPVPDMTYREKVCLPADSTATGTIVYQTDGISGFYRFDGTAWHALATAFYRHKAIASGYLMLKCQGVWMIKRKIKPNRLKP